MSRTTALALSALLLGCASTTITHNNREIRPFPSTLSQAFDDGVDYIADVDNLGGRLAADWRDQIDILTRESDLIVAVRIETVTSGAEASASGTYRLTAAAITAPIVGDRPDNNRVELRVSEGELGYNTVRANLRRLQSGEYFLFARWYTNDDGQVRAHWHLTPRTDAALQRIQSAGRTQDPNAPRTTIIRTP